MSVEERERALAGRRVRKFPDHSPPHFKLDTTRMVHLTAACYEHKSILGHSLSRMAAFEDSLTAILGGEGHSLMAWCVLPNHWHALVRVMDMRQVVHLVGQLHGRCSHAWNREEGLRGRKCWHRCADRVMRSDGHCDATVNYIHHNPVHHGYVERWQEWPYSSAAIYLKAVGMAEAERRWKEYPILDYGKGWDDPEM
jgi:putative transposase